VTKTPAPVVLIEEDEGLIALEMMESLTRKGYRVPEPVPTGEEAVERCRSLPRPDIVLMDVHLAGSIDGIDAARKIKEESPIPVIILTACDDGMIGRRMKDLAPDGYLIKPSTPEGLIAAISLVLGAHARNVLGKTGEKLSRGVREPADS
jgi:DNA-binding NarL/FixJ family response regulator